MNDIILYIALFLGLYFQIFILTTYIEHGIGSGSKSIKKLLHEKLNSNQISAPSSRIHIPSVTMLVPCFNEENTVAKTIVSLLNLQYPKDKLSVIVIDDGSRDGTYVNALKAASLPQAQGRVEVIHKENGGKHTAMNAAIPLVKSDIVGCLDADSFVAPDALIQMIGHFKDQNIMAVTPAMIVNSPKTFLQLVQKAEYNLGVFMKRVYGMLDSIYVTPGPFSLFRRTVFDEIGLFRKAYNTEDMEIAFRLQAFGYKIANCPEAYVYTNTPDTFKKLIVQRTRWTYGFINNCIDYRSMFFKKNFGNLSILILPLAVAGIFTSMYVIGNVFLDTINVAQNKFLEYATIGLNLHWPSFDTFFINTDSITILGLVLLSIVLTMLLLGRKMAEGTARPSRDILYFVITYGFIAPIWTFKAIYNTVLRKSVPWR